MYAVIRTGGKQFVVEKGSTIRIPSIEAEAGNSIELDAPLTAGNGGDADAPRVSAYVVGAVCAECQRGWPEPASLVEFEFQ